MEVISQEPVVGIRSDSVSSWLAVHVEGAAPPFSFSLITGGHSNLTYRVVDARGTRFVLRRPPLGAVLATAHDMAREHKIISGVGQTSVPVPKGLALCEDESVNDAPFYVMNFIDGHVLGGVADVRSTYPDSKPRARLGVQAVETLADLHLVDPVSVGLGDLARTEGYLDRQLGRWAKQWERSKTRDLPAMEEAHELLLQAKPEQRYSGIVHGDYRLGNMLASDSGDVAAILDWELCTLGDTLADLGYTLNAWAEPGTGSQADQETMPTLAGGFPSHSEFLEIYSERTGREVRSVEYYRAFQYWRMAAIIEGVLSRYLKGVMGDPGADVEAFRKRVDKLAESALSFIRMIS